MDNISIKRNACYGPAPFYTGTIHDIDFQKYLTEKDWECLEIDSTYKVSIDPIIYFDLDKDGMDEAIITAQTCMMGTGGPYIHTVFYLDDSENPSEYEIDYMPDRNTEVIEFLCR